MGEKHKTNFVNWVQSISMKPYDSEPFKPVLIRSRDEIEMIKPDQKRQID